MSIPIVSITPLITNVGDVRETADQIGHGCREYGFFYVINHAVDEGLQRQLQESSQRFFALDVATKLEIGMSKGGRAWRGYFPVGGELTSGKPDLKEGIYFGAELDRDHPRVKDRTPLHGSNLFPDAVPELRTLVPDYMAAMTRLGHALMRGISLSLGLDEAYFNEHYTKDPLTLFRIFNYPPQTDSSLGVGEHTDYGLLTILKQDFTGGLQVKVKSRWVDAAPVPNSFICNVGDMLDRITGGRFLSAPHRVVNSAGLHRLSFAFFFDPNFDAEVKPLPLSGSVIDNQAERWDGASVHEFHGTYGEYLVDKVSKVFPELRRDVL